MRGLAHAWDVTPAQAVAIQRELRAAVRVEPLDIAGVRTVGGCDLSADRQRGEVVAGIVVLELPGLAALDEAVIVTQTRFPYVPGLLSFRELPPLLAAFERLGVLPDAVMLDGQGLAHPRRCGLACHAGLALDRPTIGCAKSRYVGEGAEPGTERGAYALLTDSGEVVGAAVRTRQGAKPVYVSVGHRCRLQDAIELVLRCGRGYRLPEPTRLAHQLVYRHRHKRA